MTKRLFVAIDLPESIRKNLVDLDPQIHGARWMGDEQIHLTLGFFGDVGEDVEAKLRERLGAVAFRAFFIPIVGLGTFPPKGPPKIIWIGVGRGHPHLFQVHKRVQEAALNAGIEAELRPFHPHITLARCRDVPRAAVRRFLESNVDLDLGLVRIDAFHLFSSKLTPAGPIHTRELSVRAT
jgi:2'-5' RNA ligase